MKNKKVIIPVIYALLATVVLVLACGNPAQEKAAQEHVDAGHSYYAQKQWDMAIAEYTKAIELRTKLAEAYWGRGLAYYYKEDYDKAIVEYTAAIEADPNYARAYYQRAIAYLQKGDYDKAQPDFDKAVELQSKVVESQSK